MFGAILGDIAGSRFEFSKPKGFNAKTVELFADDCFFTDDTVMSIATKYAILCGYSYRVAYTELGKKYPSAGYGTMFKKWLNDPTHKPYNSYGNGSAMRVSFIGEHFENLEDVKKEARESASCTHNHPDGLQGAEATAVCIYLARNGCSKREIAAYMQRGYGYNVEYLLQFFKDTLEQDSITEVALIGVGNLGTALLNYNFSQSNNTKIVMAFDRSKKTAKTENGHIPIYPIEQLEEKLNGVEVAILTVPAAAAQDSHRVHA